MADNILRLYRGLGALLLVLGGLGALPAAAWAAGEQGSTEGSVYGKYLAGRHAHRNNDSAAA